MEFVRFKRLRALSGSESVTVRAVVTVRVNAPGVCTVMLVAMGASIPSAVGPIVNGLNLAIA